ncbi:complement C1q-like protein 2 [Sardina pilchardus]|uniref:complement C1q-like protein 2 n=1 Tax=Sardina pilchardus TaxID=27697 RepID=UPI002E0FEF8A
MKGFTVLLCLGCGLMASGQLQQNKNSFATEDTKSLPPSARDEAIENEIEIQLGSNGGHLTFFMTIAALDRRLRATERRLEELQKVNEEQASALRLMETRLSYRLITAEGKMKELGRSFSERPKIAFSASVGGLGNRGPFNTDTNLVFKDVMTNVGNAFKPATGIFTAPVKGVYLFSLFERSLSPQPASMSLHKNDQMIASVGNRASQREGDENGSNGVTLQLEQGDQVYVRLLKDSWVYDSTAHFTTFSGALLFSL